LIKCSSPIEIANYERIGQHPNFLQYYGTINTPQGPCLILEYLPNSVDFDDLYGTTPPYFTAIVEQSIDALNYIHTIGITHNDIHGGNLIWDYLDIRVVFIDDRLSLGWVLWQVLDGEFEPEIEDEIRVRNDPSSLVRLIQENRDQYPEYKEEIKKIFDLLTIPSPE
jgi:hypothetical protein